MKKIMLILGAIISTIPVENFAAVQSPQIVITFTQIATTHSQAVPLSPWLNVAIAVSLLGVVYLFSRRQVKSSLLMLVFAIVVGGMSLSPRVTEAEAGSTTLTTSPTAINISFVCGQVPYPFVNGLPNGVVITGVNLTPPTQGISIDPSSTCTVGTALTGSQQCNVVINTTGGFCNQT